MGISTQLIKYNPDMKDKWDELICLTEPGSVIHKREYVEYHSDRFEDLSICVMSGKELIAVIPGTKSGNIWTSHAGLTYGGIVSLSNDPLAYIKILEESKKFLRAQEITRMDITLPSLSFSPTTLPIQIYSLFQTGFVIDEVHLNQVIQTRFPISNKKLSNARSAERKNITFHEGFVHLPEVFEIIQGNLRTKYDRKPAHSLGELELLKKKFEKEIGVYAAYHEGVVVAGAITLSSCKITNIQYLGGTPDGKRLRAQDYLVAELYKINKSLFKDISFGKSTSGKTAVLNSALFDFKSEFNSIPENILVLSCSIS